MPNPSKRMTANPAKPVSRYRPGKAVAHEESSEDEYEEEEQQQPQTKTHPRAKPTPVQRRQQTEESEDDDEEGFVTDPEEEQDVDTSSNTLPPTSITSKPKPQPAVPTRDESDESEEEDDEDDAEGGEEDSSEEESSSSEEEATRRKFLRPTFIKKSDRKAVPAAPNDSVGDISETTQEIDEQARRLAQAELMIKDKLERDAIARAQGKKAWDDDDEVAPEDMVNDTDGLDPEAEYAAWKLRELKRLKRDREAIEAREKEIEELERRRNLTAEEREKEDKEYLEKQQEERDDGRGKASYLARYHHKGAFFQDDEAAELLKKRDLIGAKFVDEVSDKSALPEYMRIRDMTKLGKKGRTRYTDLRNEDTGRFGDEVKKWKGSSGFTREGDHVELRGVDERFLPDRDREGGRTGPTGANASSIGFRRERRSRSRSAQRGEREHRDSYRTQRQSISRSRSPPRRKRSPSPYDDRDKRRKLSQLNAAAG